MKLTDKCEKERKLVYVHVINFCKTNGVWETI